MNWLLTCIFMSIVLWILIDGFCHAEKMYQFPFLASVMTLGFVIPQLPAVANDTFLPAGAYAKTMVMGILSFLLLRAGWTASARPYGFLKFQFSEKKLLIASAFMSLIGAYFYFLLSRLPGEVSIGVQMTGMPVVYLFFGRLLTYGLAIALLCFARKPRFFSGAIIIFDLVFYLDRIIVTGKRGETIELVLMVLLAIWFYRRWIIPRSLMLAGILTGTFLMTSMSDYRLVTRSHTGFVLSDVLNIDFLGNFEKTITEGGPEMRNAVLRTDDIDRTLDLDYGKFHWNKLVFTFVPAQVVGSDVKGSLLLETPRPDRAYNPISGTTETGLIDAFASFWYFGALKFLLLSWLVCRIWKTAMAGEMLGQMLYMLSIVPAMHAVSHQTDWVLQVWVQMAMFLTPILAFCLVRNEAVPKPRAALQGPLPEFGPILGSTPASERPI